MAMIPRSEKQFGGARPAGIRLDPSRFSAGMRGEAAALRMTARSDARTAAVVEQVGGEVGRIMELRAEKMKQAEQAAQAAEAGGRIRRRLNDIELEFEQSGQVDNVPDDFEERARSAREELVASIEDPVVRAQAARDFDTIAEQGRMRMARLGFRRRIGRAEAQLDETLPAIAREAAEAATPAERELAVRRGAVLIDAQVQSGLMDEERGSDRLREFRADLDEADVRRMMTNNPEAAIAALSDPDRFTHLDEERRAQLADQANSRFDTLLNKQHREEQRKQAARDRLEREAGEAAMKEIDGAAADGTLDRDMIEQRVDVLSAVQYRTALKHLEDDGETTNVGVYSDLLARVRTDPEGVGRDAHRAYQAGDIRREDLNTVTGRVESELRRRESNEGGEPDEAKVARTWLRDMMGGNSFMLPEAAKARQAQAVLDYELAVAKAEDRGDTPDYLAIAETVMGRYDPGNASQTLTLPALKFAGQPDRSDIPAMQQALGEELAGIERAIAEDRISDAEADIYQRNLQKWLLHLRFMYARGQGPKPGGGNAN